MPPTRTLPTLAVALLISAVLPAAPPDPPSEARLIAAFNQRVLAIAVAEDRLLTLKGVRTAAMMHLAMHDALNAIEPRYTAYAWRDTAPDADPVTAAVEAAYTVAVDQYPDREAELAAERERRLAGMDGRAGYQRGLVAGKAAARAVLDRRRDDGWNREADYTWHPMAPGVYAEFHEHSGTPEGFVFGSGWATARPFFLERPDQFRSPPPPAIGSAAYAAAFDEVKAVGRHDSDVRTADQSHLAMWWKDFVENSHNRLARELAIASELDLWEAARLFALLNGAIFDAYVSVFDNKFHYNHWRPYTAIRWAAHDGNPRTVPDSGWTNLHDHTYAFPSYPSAHGCASAAAMSVLAAVFGDSTAFTMTIREVDRSGPLSEKILMDPPTRSFTAFSEAAMECSLSRVYLGIHFRYDSIEGFRLGNRVAEWAITGFLAGEE